MKLLASDFDGTLCHNGSIAAETKKAIKNWQEQGNLIGIVTGRDYRLLQASIKQESLFFDFYICSTGSAIYDKSGSLLSKRSLSSQAMFSLKKNSALKAGLYWMGSCDNQTYFCGDNQTYSFLKNLFPLIPLEEEPFFSLSSLNQMSTRFQTSEDAKKCALTINQELSQFASAYQNIDCVDIVPAKCSKATGVHDFLSALSIKPEKVLVIGDSFNDLPMIEQFHGFTVSTAEEAIQKRAAAVYDSVGALLRDFL